MASMDVNNTPKNNTLKKSKRRNNSTHRARSKEHILDYEDKGLKELPVKNENWENATKLKLRGNNLIVLYAYTLPPNLVTLDVRDCKIKYIIGGFTDKACHMQYHRTYWREHVRIGWACPSCDSNHV